MEPVRLKLNYRSGSRIVEASNAVLGEDRDYEATSEDAGQVTIWKCPGGTDGQVAAAVGQILPRLVERHVAGNVVFLFPTKNEGNALEAALKKAGRQYVRLGRNSAYPKTQLTRLLEDLARWCSGGWRLGDPRLSRLIRRWTQLQRLHDVDVERIETLKLVRFLFDHREPDSMASDWLGEFEQVVVQPDDCRTRLLGTGDIDSFDVLLDATQAGNRMEEFTVRNLGGQAGSDEHVNMLTLHSSKGCEFDAVIVVGADEGTVPRFDVTAAQAAEARRLFYVGVSRARRQVHVLYSPSDGSKYRQGPSRFVKDMADALGLKLT